MLLARMRFVDETTGDWESVAGGVKDSPFSEEKRE
jgi:hypothetical protein